MEGTYDPQKVTVTWAGITFGGFADGSMIKAARNEDGFMLTVGTDGSAARTKNANKSGTFTVRLKPSSPTNTLLQAAASLDELAGAATDPFFVKDSSSLAANAHARNAWIKKVPDWERAKELGEVEWVFETDSIEIFHTGIGA